MPASALQLSKKRVSEAGEKAQKVLQHYRARAVTLTKDPHFRTVTVTTGCGAITLSAVGGAFGCATGIVTGSIAGTIPALFTLGLSIPAGGVIGGGVGLAAGVTAGGAAGAAGGGLAGYGGYKYRAELAAGVLQVKTSAKGGIESVKVRIVDSKNAARNNANRCLEFVSSKASQAGSAVVARLPETSKLERKHYVAGGAGAGAVAGGGAGCVAGGAIGAAVGVPAALFTFGLSIPVCAVIGAGVGTSAGSTGGAVVGGAAGYGGHKYRKEIDTNVRGFRARLSNSAGHIKAKATERATHAREQISAMLGGTGGTE
jgi:hypothetical protein